MSIIREKTLYMKLVTTKGIEKIKVANEIHEEKLKSYSTYLSSTVNNKNFDGLISVPEFCRTLQFKDVFIGRNHMYQFLRDNKIIMKNNMPYEKYSKKDYFRIKRHNCAGKVHFQLYITLKGADFLVKRYWK